MKIKALKASEILDSLGNPTIETEIWLEDGSYSSAAVPSGETGTHKYECLDLRDKDPNRFNGLGVLKAVDNVNKIIAPKIINQDASYQGSIDRILIELDNTPNKANLGANSMLSVSQAVCEASAISYKMPLYKYLAAKYQMAESEINIPRPIFSLISGGQHSTGNLDFQEFHLIPSGSMNFNQALECGEEVYQLLRKILVYRGAIFGISHVGGFTPNLFTNMDALEIIVEAVKASKYALNREVFLGLDAAADFLYQNGRYKIKDRDQPFNREEFLDYYQNLYTEYKIFYLEDALHDDDFEGWSHLLNKMAANHTLIVADDMTSTNFQRLKKAVEKKACQGILIKPNQVGTISQTIEIIQLAKNNNLRIIAALRSGETNDDFMADFSVGIGADYIKFGAPSRGERIAKYNRLLKIAAQLKPANKKNSKNFLVK